MLLEGGQEGGEGGVVGRGGQGGEVPYQLLVRNVNPTGTSE